jgi:two-component system response regulator BaeR
MSAHILIAEDENKIASLLADYVKAAGMCATVIDHGNAVVAAVGVQQPDLLLLDIMLPGTDGLTLCREIRAFSALPIIMLTARSEEIDRLLGLELGADDYICKPFSPREVIARIKAILRRVGTPQHAHGTPPSLEIDDYRMRVELDGKRVDVTPVEFKLVQVLARHPGRVYRRDELLDLIYDDFRDVSDRTVDSHIKNLRRKLEQILPERRIIQSVYGIGYKLELD